jgi:hypothetical protein
VQLEYFWINNGGDSGDGNDDTAYTEIAGHKRAKRGRKPLDPALDRHLQVR